MVMRKRTKRTAKQGSREDDGPEALPLEPLWLAEWRALAVVPGTGPGEQACEAIIWHQWDGFALDHLREVDTDVSIKDAHLCPSCGYLVHMRGPNGRNLYQCKECRHQTSTMALTVLRNARVPLRQWFAALDAYALGEATPSYFQRLFKVNDETAKRMIARCRFVFEENNGSLFRSEVRDKYEQWQEEQMAATRKEWERSAAWIESLTDEQKKELHRAIVTGRNWNLRQLIHTLHQWAENNGIIYNDKQEESLSRISLFASRFTD